MTIFYFEAKYRYDLCFYIIVTLGIIAMIVWLVQIPTDHYPGYSFGLAVVAYILFFLAGVLMIPDIRRYQGRHHDLKKVRPDRRSEVERTTKYQEYKRQDYSYNRRFTPDSNIRHYYNPNREPYTGRTPPPKYKTLATPHTYGRSTRSEVQTPDVYLGRDGRRRY